MLDYKNLTMEELKEEFLKYFPESKWDEMDMLEILDNYQSMIINKYLHIEYTPVIFEEHMKEESIYDNKEDCILISNEYNKELLISFKLMCIELRHKAQIIFINDSNNINKDNYLLFKKQLELNLKPNYDNPEELGNYLFQDILIDRISFASIMLKKFFNIDYHHPNILYDELIHQNIKNNYEFLLNIL